MIDFALFEMILLHSKTLASCSWFGVLILKALYLTSMLKMIDTKCKVVNIPHLSFVRNIFLQRPFKVYKIKMGHPVLFLYLIFHIFRLGSLLQILNPLFLRNLGGFVCLSQGGRGFSLMKCTHKQYIYCAI